VLRFLVWIISAALKPKGLLVAENLCLRQQLLVLQRRHPQPRLRNADRQFWICASRWFTDWRNSLLIVKPETVLRWHRRGWRAYFFPRHGVRPGITAAMWPSTCNGWASSVARGNLASRSRTCVNF
jgi:hypothetical protein